MRYLVLLVLLFAGCEVQSPHIETAVERENRLIQFGVANFPNGAKKVMDLGNGWYTFDLEVNNKTHRLLYHKSWAETTHGYEVPSESLTELSQ